ncbi:dATP/dGTP diphosphohydrolase domain-containing protein [Sulfitobacter sp. PS-8MA]|uniref:dATP/dGTP diphosphohydrolase domain-containing protein n=1 Tax=Sulfitobacter sp. PS-8MA TaxID=3237707 RepID=UPI0034C62ABD
MNRSDILSTAAKPVEGRKFDGGKPRVDLVPSEFVLATADILTFGAEKYGSRNWEAGMAWGRPYAALQRHMLAWWAGQDTDEETGKSHLHHAACCLAFLIAYEARGAGEDDRPERRS